MRHRHPPFAASKACRRVARGWCTIAALLYTLVVSTGASGENQQAPGTRPPDLLNTLSWTTDSELNVFGFYVYRSSEHEQAFSRLNENPVPARGGPDLGARYRYTDRTIQPGISYRYYITQLSNSGREERLTPVLTASPKFPSP